MDNRGRLWTPRSYTHPMHRQGGLLPSAVPSFTHVPHSPTQRLGVTAFTRPGDERRSVAEQWTAVWRSCGPSPPACGPPVDNVDHRLWTERPSTACGQSSATIPQGRDLGRSSRTRAACGRESDNFPVPSLWTADSPRICGERRDRHGYSNSPDGAGPAPTPCGLLRTAQQRPGAGRRAARRAAVGVLTTDPRDNRDGRPAARRATPRRLPLRPPGGNRTAARRPPCRDGEGRPGNRPGTPSKRRTRAVSRS